MPKLLWTNRSNFGPSPRANSAMCFDSARNRTVLFGGLFEDPAVNSLGDTWEWDGALWTQMADTGPAPRHDFALAYDSARKVSVLFGGTDSSFFGDTWQWDGDAWTKLSESGPGPRTSTAMAFDSNRNRVVLFGGQTADKFHTNDTWEFDGDDWTQVQDAGPPARNSHAMAFDSVANRVILFGGSGDNDVALDDTWAWDGNEWVQIAEFGPSPRLSASMTSASGSNFLLFGGFTVAPEGAKPTAFSDTWGFDGKRWTQRQDIGPGPLLNPAMAFDSTRSTVVLFGGLVPNPGGVDPVSGLTWEVPVTPAAPPVVVPPLLKLLSIEGPDTAVPFTNITLTFLLSGPANPGGTVVRMNTPLTDQNGTAFTQFTVPAGATSFNLTGKYQELQSGTITAGVQAIDEAAHHITVVL